MVLSYWWLILVYIVLSYWWLILFVVFIRPLTQLSQLWRVVLQILSIVDKRGNWLNVFWSQWWVLKMTRPQWHIFLLILVLWRRRLCISLPQGPRTLSCIKIQMHILAKSMSRLLLECLVSDSCFHEIIFMFPIHYPFFDIFSTNSIKFGHGFYCQIKTIHFRQI